MVQARRHRPHRAKPLIVVSSTPKPRILRKGLTPRISSSAAHTRIATAERRLSVVCGVPPAALSRRAIDNAIKTDNATFGHWATVMPPVRRLTNIHRTIRRYFEEPPGCAIASSGNIAVTLPTVGHNRTGTATGVRRDYLRNCPRQTSGTRFDPRIELRNQRVGQFRARPGGGSWPPRPAART
jgi:hypothetical protein